MPFGYSVTTYLVVLADLSDEITEGLVHVDALLC